MWFRVQDFGFGVQGWQWGLWFGVYRAWGLGFRILGLGFGVQGLQWGLVFKVCGLVFRGSGLHDTETDHTAKLAEQSNLDLWHYSEN